MSCYLYLICAGSKFKPVKIGIAADVEARRAQLQTGSIEELRVVEKFEASSREQATDWEYLAHRLFDAHRVRGEWFDVDVATVIKHIDRWQTDRPKREKPRRKPRTNSSDFNPFHPVVPQRLIDKRMRDMTRAERLEYWACFDLDEPPYGFDDWFLVGNGDSGVLAAFPVVGFMDERE